LGPRPPPAAPGFKPYKPQSEFEKNKELIDLFRSLAGLSKGSAGGAAVAKSAGEADARGALKAELEQKLGRNALIQKEYQEKRKDLLIWAGEVKRFKAGSMHELLGFIQRMDENLGTLTEQLDVLKLMGDEWPEGRYDDMSVIKVEYE
jgi:hypothetical protein